jgi:hypothetical protein
VATSSIVARTSIGPFSPSRALKYSRFREWEPSGEIAGIPFPALEPPGCIPADAAHNGILRHVQKVALPEAARLIAKCASAAKIVVGQDPVERESRRKDFIITQ